MRFRAGNIVSVGEVVMRSGRRHRRAPGARRSTSRRAASSPLEVGGPIEPRADGEDARKKQMLWEEELRRELEVQRAEMRRCVSRDRAVSAV